MVYTTDGWENISRDLQPINSHSNLAKTKPKKKKKPQKRHTKKICIYKISLSLSVGKGKQKEKLLKLPFLEHCGFSYSENTEWWLDSTT